MYPRKTIRLFSPRLSIETSAERSFKRLPMHIQATYINQAQAIGADPISLYLQHQQPLLDNSNSNDILYTQNLDNLDNCTNASQMPEITEGECDMAKHRMRICIDYNVNGKPIIKQVSGNTELELADNITCALLQSKRKNEFIDSSVITDTHSSLTFKEYTEEWLANYKVGKCKPTTLNGYHAMLQKHLYPAFGEMPIDRIETKSIQTFLNERQELSAKYLRDIKNLLSQILESAKRDHLCQDNHANDPRLSIPSEKKKNRKALTNDEVSDILKHMNLLTHHEQKYLALLIFTGMRRGEVLGLRFEDIDLMNNELSVSRNVTYAENQPHISTPKTKSGFRTIPILPGLLPYLLPLKEQGFVIGDGETPLTNTQFRTLFRHIQEKVDLHGATSHTFRHTMGTFLNDTGADVKTIQGILGQKDYKTTMDRYVHPVETRKQEAANRVNELLIV